MHFLAWTITGLLAGGLARVISGAEKRGCILTMVIGLIGAWIGGGLAKWAGWRGIDGFGIRSILVAAAGAVLFLLVLQALGLVKKK